MFKPKNTPSQRKTRNSLAKLCSLKNNQAFLHFKLYKGLKKFSTGWMSKHVNFYQSLALLWLGLFRRYLPRNTVRTTIPTTWESKMLAASTSVFLANSCTYTAVKKDNKEAASNISCWLSTYFSIRGKTAAVGWGSTGSAPTHESPMTKLRGNEMVEERRTFFPF